MARVVPVLSWCGQVVAWLVILGIGAILAVALIVPRLTGATPYVILTGSMRPAMPPGTLVVVRPERASELAVGDVVTYQLRSGEPQVVTHRIVAAGVNARGPAFITRGDANEVADSAPVLPVQIRGERWYSVPYLGYVTNLLTGAQRHAATLVLAAGLSAYALWMFGGALVGARVRRP